MKCLSGLKYCVRLIGVQVSFELVARRVRPGGGVVDGQHPTCLLMRGNGIHELTGAPSASQRDGPAPRWPEVIRSPLRHWSAHTKTTALSKNPKECGCCAQSPARHYRCVCVCVCASVVLHTVISAHYSPAACFYTPTK